MTKKFISILAGLMLMLFVPTVQAQLLVEDFDYTIGSLLTANGWSAHSGAGTQAIDVTTGLSFAGYKGSDVGGAANVDNNGEDVNKTFTAQTSGTVYAAFLVNVANANATGDYFFHLGPSPIGTSFRGRVFAKKDNDNLYFGVANAGTTTAVYFSTPHSFNTTYLLVLKYTIVEGANNDQVSLNVLSAFSASEPTSGWLASTDVISSEPANIGAVGIRQGTNFPALKLDGIRVGNTWAEAVAPAGVVTKVSTPNFSPGGGSVTGPVQVAITSATEGSTIYYTLDGSEPDNTKNQYSTPISVTTTTSIKAIAYKSGLDASNVATATYTFPTSVANIAALRANTSGLFKLTGEVVLTFKTADRNAKYIQDASGGILIDDASGLITTNYNIGDGITGITGTMGVYAGMLQFTPVANPGAATSTGNNVAPKAVALSEIVNYPAQLVKVSGVTIDGEGVFAARTNYNLNGGSNPIIRTAYNDLPYINSGIPQGPQDITGVVLIFNETAQLVPRTAADFTTTVITAPTLIISEVLPLYGAMVGQTVKDTIKVDAYNLTGNVTVALSGSGASSFAVSPASLSPVGGSLTKAEVEIVYQPTFAGDHTATLTFSSPGATDVVKTLNGRAFAMAGNGTVDNPFTVSDVIALANSLGIAQKYWVKGFIVGSANGGSNGVLTTVATVAPFANTSLAIAPTAVETNLALMVPVQLPVGDVRTALNLLDNPANQGKEVKVYGTLEAYFTAPGVRNVTEYAMLTSLPSVDANQYRITTRDGQLMITASEAAKVEVFNAVGQMIYNGRLAVGQNTVQLNTSGMVIVKIDAAVQKVVM